MRTTRRLLYQLSSTTLAFVLAGAMLAGVASTPAGAAAVSRDAKSILPGTMPGQVAPIPPRNRFIPTPTYGSAGLALVVYTGGTVDDLEVAAGDAGASGVWVQDVTGRFQLLPVHGPIFLQSGFASAFPAAAPGAANFTQMIAVMLVR